MLGMKGRRDRLRCAVRAFFVESEIYDCIHAMANKQVTQRMGERILFTPQPDYQLWTQLWAWLACVCVWARIVGWIYVFQTKHQVVQSSSHVKMTNDNIYRSWSISWRSPERIRWPRKRKCLLVRFVQSDRVRFITHFTSHYSIGWKLV